MSKIRQKPQDVIVGSRNLKRVVKQIKWDKLRRCRRGFVVVDGALCKVWERPRFWTDLKCESRGGSIHYFFKDALNRKSK